MKTQTPNKEHKQTKNSKPLFIFGIAALLLLITIAALLITNIVIKNKGADASVEAGTLISEKYGTFVIPHENMFIRPDLSAGLSFSNGTDFTYFFDEFMSKLAKYRKVDVITFKAENQMLFQLDAYNVMQNNTYITEEEFRAITNSVDYPFSDAQSYYGDRKSRISLVLNNNKLTFDIDKYAKWNNTPRTMNFLGYNINCVPKTALANWKISGELSIGDEKYCSENIKCLSKKVEMTIDNETTNYHIPVAIISDKGYPLTETIYNEIMADKAK